MVKKKKKKKFVQLAGHWKLAKLMTINPLGNWHSQFIYFLTNRILPLAIQLIPLPTMLV